MLQRHTIQKLYGDERLRLSLPNVIDCADIRMVQRRGRLRLSLESRQGLRVSRHILGEEFQRNKTVQPYVLSLIDHAHTATTELFYDSVVRDGLTHELGRCAHCWKCYAAIVGGVNEHDREQ